MMTPQRSSAKSVVRREVFREQDRKALLNSAFLTLARCSTFRYSRSVIEMSHVTLLQALFASRPHNSGYLLPELFYGVIHCLKHLLSRTLERRSRFASTSGY